MKDAFYFPHDSNARHDPRIESLCTVYKNNGYACFFKTIEMLREQTDYTIPEKLFPAVFLSWRSYGDDINEANAKQMLSTMIELGLLSKNDQNCIYSPSLLRRMEKRQEIIEKRKLSGAKGGIAKAYNNLANAKQMLSKPLAGKERKGKEKKGKDIIAPPEKKLYLSYVYLSDVEHSKLVTRFGAEDAARKIYKLNNYVGSTGKKYISHYHTILNWAENDAKQPAIA